MEPLTLHVNNINTKVTHPCIGETRPFLWETLSYMQKDYTSRWGNKYGTRKSVYNTVHDTFLTGLLDKVTKALDNRGVSYIINDHRVKPDTTLKDAKLNNVELRDYQLEAVEEAIKMNRGIFDMSVGAGKTEIAIAIMKKLDLPVLFIVHLKSLIVQTKQRIEDRLGITPAIFGSGSFQFGKITVASIQSLQRYKDVPEVKEYLSNVKVVMIDECHRISKNTYYDVLNRCNAFYRFGFSGTPLKRSDNINLYTTGLLGSVVYKVKSSELIEKGYLVIPKVMMFPIKSFLDFNTNYYEFRKTNNWHTIYKLGIVENQERNMKITAITRTMLEEIGRESVLVLIREIKHGRILQKMLSDELGYDVPFLYGKSSINELEEEVTKFKKKEINCVIASTIFDEGVDIPNIDTIIIGAGGESTIKITQRLGRGIRKAKNKENVIIVDFMDNSHYVLSKHSNKRYKVYKEEEKFEVSKI